MVDISWNVIYDDDSFRTCVYHWIFIVWKGILWIQYVLSYRSHRLLQIGRLLGLLFSIMSIWLTDSVFSSSSKRSWTLDLRHSIKAESCWLSTKQRYWDNNDNIICLLDYYENSFNQKIRIPKQFPEYSIFNNNCSIPLYGSLIFIGSSLQ